MGEKNYSYRYSSNENTTTGTSDPNSRPFELTRLESLILKCTKSKPKSEAKISKEVKTNLPIVSQIITDLMLKGLMERTRKRRILFANREYFSTSLEGLIALERTRRNTANYAFFSQLFFGLKDGSHRIIEEITMDSIAFKLVIGSIKIVCRMAKYALTK
jgi:DNA-binding MarR family transcriptional regulator